MIRETVPTLPAGVTWLRDDADRSVAPHHLVLEQLEATGGQALWVDARDAASTYALHARSTSSRTLSSLRVARAWTAYQHHTLVRRTVDRASQRTCLIVLPHVCSLYRDDDLDETEADRLLAASLHTLSALASALDVPVLLTAPSSEESSLDPVIDRELRYERTRYGFTFVGESFRTTVHRERGWWQTTIPYWVELFGTAEAESAWRAAAERAGLDAYA